MDKKTLNIIDVANACPGITLQVGASELARFGRDLIASARAEFNQERLKEGAAQLEPLYNAAEVKAALKISDATLFRWAQRGYLSPIIVGGEKRYRRSDLDRILNHSK